MKKIICMLLVVSSMVSFSKTIDQYEVRDIVLKEYPEAKIVKVEKSNYKGKGIFSVKALYRGREVDFKIDSKTGNIYSMKEKYDDETYSEYDVVLTFEEAKEIALSNTVNATIETIELKHKNNRAYYEVDLIENGIEIDMDIDANTGEILKIKQEI